jgi:hypothetical protein
MRVPLTSHGDSSTRGKGKGMLITCCYGGSVDVKRTSEENPCDLVCRQDGKRKGSWRTRIHSSSAGGGRISMDRPRVGVR